MRIMEVVGWYVVFSITPTTMLHYPDRRCAFVQPVSSQAEVDRLVGNAVSKRSLKGDYSRLPRLLMGWKAPGR